MKTAILLFTAILGIIAFTDKDKNISGTWVLQPNDSLSEKAILRVQMGEGIWNGKLDIPQQDVYDKALHSIKVSGDSIFITVFKNGTVIKAKMINDSMMTATRQLDKNIDNIQLKKIR